MLSMVLRVEWGGHEIWLMGDALAVQERDLLDLGDPGHRRGVGLLKAGHHGSDTATCREWLEVLSPRAVLLTAEVDNRFGFPSRAVLDRCRDAGADVLVTGPTLGLLLEARGDGWDVRPGLEGAQ
jgi:competence protein ComEC